MSNPTELYLLRHAKALEPGKKWSGCDDRRPLSVEGAKKMRAIALGMRALKLKFDVILSSPYVRARQTAEIAAEAFKLAKKIKYSTHLAPTANPAELLTELQERGLTGRAILVVGHEPFLTGLVSLLTTGQGGLALNFKKAGLCRLTVSSFRPGRCAMLDWFLPPQVLARLAK